MKDLSLQTRSYILLFYALGIGLLYTSLSFTNSIDYLMVVVLSALAAFLLIFKVEGATNRSHFTFSFLIYGFAFAYFGLGETLLVILISNLLEWAWKRPPWFIQLFNTACYIAVMAAAYLVFRFVNPDGLLSTPRGILAVSLSLVVFTILNHLFVGIIVWMARGENFKVSGIFDIFPLLMDLTFLTFGAILNLVWGVNPFALLLFLFPLYMIYSTMRIPALERKTELDQKTNLYNHEFFMQQLKKELDRANRFDRPLSVMMLDLDLLRNINNTYGHLAGDEVLIGVAHILKQSVREYDVVARFGGEEFSIMLPETTIQQTFERGEVIRRAIESAQFTVPTSVMPIRVTISLGISERESYTQTAQEIIHNSDTALYRSKLNGRNQTFAYANYTYLKFSENLKKVESAPDVQTNAEQMNSDQSAGVLKDIEKEYSAAQKKYIKEVTGQAPTVESTPVGVPSKKPGGNSKSLFKSINIYICGLALLAAGLSYGLFHFAPELYRVNWVQIWPGLLITLALLVLTELYSIDLYLGKTSLSTSAVPMLAGTLLFGPAAGLILSATYAILVGIKYRSAFNKYIFNFSNQVIAVMIYTAVLHLAVQPFRDYILAFQIIFSIFASLIVYIINTTLISIGMGIDLRQSPVDIWKEQYAWLLTIYVGVGLIAGAYVFGYLLEGVFGALLMMVPVLLLRISQKQYVDRTREVVTELRQKNITLEKNAGEISQLNEGLLDTLSEIIDLRDPNVLGHSKNVSKYAAAIAKLLGLKEKQVEMIRKAGLLHDIGKLGISMQILTKPGGLTVEEYENIKKHPTLGGELVKNSPSLRPLVSIIRNHHEFFNGAGYPDKLKENQIPIEARIVGVADAIDAMLSDRPYRKGLKPSQVVEELKKYSGSQFDPAVVRAAKQMLEKFPEDSGDQPVSQSKTVLDAEPRIPIS